MKQHESQADPRRLLSIGAMLTGVSVLYVFVVSDWYWTCNAQIDPMTLAPVKCASPQPVEKCVPTQTGGPQQGGSFEDRLWPCFGSGNSTFDDLSVFWGGDFLSKLIHGVFMGFALLGRPFVASEIVPRWNEVMVSSFNRSSLFAVLSALFGFWGRAWAKDMYQLMRRPSRNTKAS